MKTNSLYLKIFSNQRIEVDIADEDVATNATWDSAVQLQHSAKFIKDVEREECDLPFVIFNVVKKTIAAQTTTGDAFHRRDLDHRKVIRLASMVADKVMAG
ncbi:MAG TPA: hypothetical protein VEH26_02770 [Chthoniobacterales bacterium]|nr:hypothetical protein [Chthoniobacterales bacterium]